MNFNEVVRVIWGWRRGASGRVEHEYRRFLYSLSINHMANGRLLGVRPIADTGMEGRLDKIQIRSRMRTEDSMTRSPAVEARST